MNPKHRKTRSESVPRKRKNLIPKKILKQNIEEIKLVNSLIGKQSIKWSFGKANRFNSKDPDPSTEYLSLRSSLGEGRKAGFGYGKRWQPSNPRGKDAPPSTTYTIPGSLDRKIVGGKISPSRLRSNDSRLSTPGPGTYNIKTCIGEGLSCTLKSRHAALARHSTPPPGTYNPIHSLVESGRYSNITFGGKISVSNMNRLSTPGPGSYDLSSCFTSVSNSPSPKRINLLRKNSI